MYVTAVKNKYLFKYLPTQKYVVFFKLIAALFLPLERTSVFSAYKLKWKEIGVRVF